MAELGTSFTPKALQVHLDQRRKHPPTSSTPAAPVDGELMRMAIRHPRVEPAQGNQQGRRHYAPKACRRCRETFTPTGARALDCPSCRQAA